MDPHTVTTEVEVPANLSNATMFVDSHSPLPKHQFYHSQSGQPLTLDEVISDVRDSKNEADNKAEAEASDLMIDASMDDDEIMENFIQVWNSFAKKNRILADAHIPWACEEFSKLYKKELQDNLKFDMCWRLFMIKQCNYGILDAATITKCNTIIQQHPTSLSHMDVDKNNHKSKNNENNKETTTHASGSESNMCINGEQDELDAGVKALHIESSQVVAITTPFHRSLEKRPIKQTPKIKEMIEMKWDTLFGQGSSSHRGHGRKGRGGRGCGGRGDL